MYKITQTRVKFVTDSLLICPWEYFSNSCLV